MSCPDCHNQTRAIEALMVVIDQCDRALGMVSKTDDLPASYLHGITMIRSSALTEMTALGFLEVPSVEFDPHYHEAIQTVDGEEHGRIAQILERGWQTSDGVVRYAKVIVYKETHLPWEIDLPPDTRRKRRRT